MLEFYSVNSILSFFFVVLTAYNRNRIKSFKLKRKRNEKEKKNDHHY